MVDLIKGILNFLLENYALYLVIAMGAIVSITIGLLTLIKKPIKKWTSKIANERLRKLANKMFIFFAFAITSIIWLVLSWCSSHYFAFDGVQVLLTGALSVVIYALGDGVINAKTAKELTENTIKIAEDKKVDSNDKDLINECLDNFKKL